MKSVSTQDLKKHLSALIDEAAAGDPIVITRHGRPVASLVGARPDHVHRGPLFGRRGLRSLLRRATRGRYLEVLDEDRREPTARAGRRRG